MQDQPSLTPTPKTRAAASAAPPPPARRRSSARATSPTPSSASTPSSTEWSTAAARGSSRWAAAASGLRVVAPAERLGSRRLSLLHGTGTSHSVLPRHAGTPATLPAPPPCAGGRGLQGRRRPGHAQGAGAHLLCAALHQETEGWVGGGPGGRLWWVWCVRVHVLREGFGVSLGVRAATQRNSVSASPPPTSHTCAVQLRLISNSLCRPATLLAITLPLPAPHSSCRRDGRGPAPAPHQAGGRHRRRADGVGHRHRLRAGGHPGAAQGGQPEVPGGAGC
jgi:hypothetical protein